MAILGTAALLVLIAVAILVGGARLPARARPLDTVRREPERWQAGPPAPADPPEAA